MHLDLPFVVWFTSLVFFGISENQSTVFLDWTSKNQGLRMVGCLCWHSSRWRAIWQEWQDIHKGSSSRSQQPGIGEQWDPWRWHWDNVGQFPWRPPWDGTNYGVIDSWVFARDTFQILWFVIPRVHPREWEPTFWRPGFWQHWLWFHHFPTTQLCWTEFGFDNDEDVILVDDEDTLKLGDPVPPTPPKRLFQRHGASFFPSGTTQDSLRRMNAREFDLTYWTTRSNKICNL